jgi:hypothetical protein
MRRAVLAALLACLLVPVSGVGAAATHHSAPRSTAATGVSDGDGPLDNPTDLRHGMHYQRLIKEHDGGGFVVPLTFTAWPHLDPKAKPVRMHGEADSGNYTGVYLASQGYRYSMAKAELAKLAKVADPTAAQRKAKAYWTRQKAQALAWGKEITRYYHLLVNIAKNWHEPFNPTIDQSKTPGGEGWLDLGGNPIPAEAGLLMRICTPTRKADQKQPWADVRLNYGDQGRLIGPLPFEGKKYYCLGATSRDSYSGTYYGLGVALDQFADVPSIRNGAAKDLISITNYATKYLWTQPRPTGSIPSIYNGNDLDGPISPMWLQVPLHQLCMLQLGRHAAAVIGDTIHKIEFDALYEVEAAAYIPSGALVAGALVDAANPHNSNYKYQLNFMNFWHLIRLETNPVFRQAYEVALSAMTATTNPEGNAYFEAMQYALFGDRDMLRRAVVHHHQWLQYIKFSERAAARGQVPVDHAVRCSIKKDPGPGAPVLKRPLDCVPKNQVDIVQPLPGGKEIEQTFLPGTDSDLRAKEPLPVPVRRLADFLWQKDPTILTGDHDVPWRGPSVDFLITYWIIRYFSEDVHPAPGSLPAWPGPHFT